MYHFLTYRDEVAFAAMIDGDGEVTDFLRLPHLMKRGHEEARELKVCHVSLVKKQFKVFIQGETFAKSWLDSYILIIHFS